MDRRDFVGCSMAAGCLAWAAARPAFAAGRPLKRHARVLLTGDTGRPLKAANLRPQVNYIFHYPFEATPVLLLDLGRAVMPLALSVNRTGEEYEWPGGVGPRRSIVAFSAICSHKLVYPTREVSFISFRRQRARRGVDDALIHCCADHSQYDPSKGSMVVAGPAPEPLAAVLLEHDRGADTLTAYGTVGDELFDAFFTRYAAKLDLEHGPRARERVTGEARVWELEKFCRNNIQC